jgi:predicted NUDIX family NTP pyrophosphohydrolase
MAYSPPIPLAVVGLATDQALAARRATLEERARGDLTGPAEFLEYGAIRAELAQRVAARTVNAALDRADTRRAGPAPALSPGAALKARTHG